VLLAVHPKGQGLAAEEEAVGEDEVAGARDRQELGEALDDAEGGRANDVHARHANEKAPPGGGAQ